MRPKEFTKKLLQSVFGFETYLYYFSRYKIDTLHRDPNEKIMFRFIDLIPDGSLILDIGANLGFITYHLAQKRDCAVLSFEPIPTNLAVLNRIVANKKLANVTVCPYALGDVNATVNMVMPLENGVPMQGLSHVKTDGETTEGREFTVPVKRLDELIEISSSGKRVGGIKIDAEDYEYFILTGGLNLIKKDKPVICVELWENENRERSLLLLASLGYTPYVLSNGDLVKLAGQSTHLDGNNFVCLPN
ncbi:MAG: FkbM family methyltransferase [Bacteroidetes bacterium]|nr:FkbM family methyltransferase [Fibrella sp.]